MTRSKPGAFMPVLFLFIALTALFVAGRHVLEQWNLDTSVVLIGNLFLFLITFLSFVISVNGFKSTNPHAFLRSVYSSIMVKLFLCIIVAFIYISIYKSSLNKPALFTCMGLYLVYTFLEVSILMKLLKRESK